MTYRVAIIGRTGAGNYGHQLDQAFVGNPRAEVVALADPDEAGRAAAIARTGAQRSYADYQEMLVQEKPDIVVVAPRHIDCHLPMVLASIDAGAHVYCEKPFAQTLEQADQMIVRAEQARVKIAVALPFRHEQRTEQLLALLEQGAIGQLQSMRGWCKYDHRGGGEDWAILGPHFADLMRYIAGDPLWCSGWVRGDAPHPGGEQIGLIAGDRITAQYEFGNGIFGTLESWRYHIEEKPRQPYRLELHGTKGILAIRAPYGDHSLWYYPDPFFQPDGPAWERIPTAVTAPYGEYHKPSANDLLNAIEEKREPRCSGRDGRWALEMILAPYAAHRLARRVELPQTQRQHPLNAYEAIQ